MGSPVDLVRPERLSLVELLEGLTPEEWATPSLCSAWTVQQVAAHVAWAPVAPAHELARGLVRHRFRLNALNADLGVQWSKRGTEAILDQLRANAASNAKPVRVPPGAMLADAVIHSLDIRRPLGRPRPIPQDAFAATADFQLGLRWPLSVTVGGSARERVAGVRLVAEDADWSHGEGPGVGGDPAARPARTSRRPGRAQRSGRGCAAAPPLSAASGGVTSGAATCGTAGDGEAIPLCEPADPVRLLLRQHFPSRVVAGLPLSPVRVQDEQQVTEARQGTVRDENSERHEQLLEQDIGDRVGQQESGLQTPP